MFKKEKFYTITEVAQILWVDRQTIVNVIKSGTLKATNIWSSKKATYRIAGINIIAWMDNYSDLEVLLQFIEFYVDRNGIEETQKTINNYFDNIKK